MTGAGARGLYRSKHGQREDGGFCSSCSSEWRRGGSEGVSQQYGLRDREVLLKLVGGIRLRMVMDLR